MKHGKMDGRFSGGRYFNYKVEFLSRDRVAYCKIREWCWEQFGSSCELDFWRPDEHPGWCWLKDNDRVRIYFVSEKEYSWFVLRWAN